MLVAGRTRYARSGLVCGIFGFMVLAGTAAQAQPANGATERALLDRYCVTCHNARQKVADLQLDQADVQRVAANPEIWEKVVRKLRAGAMPPAGMPRPDETAYDRFASWLEDELDRGAQAAPDPGRTLAFHRLNRAEYQNAIRDLLDVEAIDMGLLLPADDVSYGFDNIAGVLKLSSTLLERYLSAARKISQIAVGDPGIVVDTVSYLTRDDMAQWERFEDLPFGTRGGMLVRHDFPVSGEYTLTVGFEGARGVLRPPDDLEDTLEVTIDGEPVLVHSLGLERPSSYGGDRRVESIEVRVPVRAGRRRVSATFVKITSALFDGVVQEYAKPRPHSQLKSFVRRIGITGPFDPVVAETPSRRRIFTCRPSGAQDELRCAREIMSTLARRAYRRPVTADDVGKLMTFYEVGREERGFEGGITRAIERLLVSPSFLFRVATDPADVTPGEPYRISDVELASRLSFFLWSSIPDDELLRVAADGRLRDPVVLEQQVTRMLASPKSDVLVKNFTGQWLQLRNLDAKSPNEITFPYFNDNLRQSFRRETERMFEHVLREEHSVLDLLNGDYTFLNEQLARHYGIPDVYGTRFRRVTLTDEARYGLLGHGSILTVTAFATRTSPVVRGKWILDNLLGASPPPPPPNVPTLAEKTAAGQALSMREAMTRHRANAACASCHALMDPLGFALENFDGVGRWRTMSEANTPIDASGSLPNGKTFEGVNGLRRVLLSQPERFVSTVTEKLLIYALGRGVDYYDMPAVRTIVREAAPGNYALSSLVLGVIKSVPFQMRRAES